jgi:hypothetical protein
MTWLGKILTFVVMIAAVVWMYFTVQAYTTRTNWKVAHDKLKAEYDKISAASATEANRNKTSEDALKRLYVNQQTLAENLQKQVVELAKANKDVVTQVAALQKTIAEGDVKSVQLQANIDVTLKEMDTIRARNTVLEDQTTQLVIKAEDAKRDMVRAQNERKLAQSIADDYGKKNDELQTMVAELKSGGSDLKRLTQKAPPPVLSNLRGEVTNVAGDFVELSIGIDAGLSKGSVLELSRIEGGGRYLGTVRVTDLYPKKAVAVFTPARANVAFAQLRPEELPKKGDQVRPLESSVVGR